MTPPRRARSRSPSRRRWTPPPAPRCSRVDGAGPDANVAYVGGSKRAAADAAAAAAAPPPTSPRRTCAALPANARKPVLRAALAAWLEQAGGVPPGNERLSGRAADTRGVGPASGGKATSRDGARVSSSDEARTASASPLAFELASAAVTPSAVDALCRDGFVVLDDVAPPETLLAARASAEHLRADGKMHHVGQEGRDDAVAVLDASSLPSSRSRYGGLAGAAALTLAFAEALRVRSAETALLTNKEKTKRTPRAARTLDRLRGVQPPSRRSRTPGTKTPGARCVRTWTTTGGTRPTRRARFARARAR